MAEMQKNAVLSKKGESENERGNMLQIFANFI